MKKTLLVYALLITFIGGFAQQPRLVLPIGHTSVILSAQFSPNSKMIATGSNDNTAKIWDAETGKLLADLTGHSGDVHSISFSFDGKKIATASWEDITIKIWDAKAGKLLFDLTGHTKAVRSAIFNNDSRKIVTASDDKTAKIWDAKTGKLLFDLFGHSEGVNSANFSYDGRKIVTASDDNTAKIWDAETGKLLADIIGHSSRVNSANFSPDGKKIVTASKDGTSKIWDAQSGELLIDLTGYSSISSANFSPDGKRIVTASDDKTAKIWDAETGKLLTDLTGHSSNLILAIFSHNGKKIVTVSSQSTAKIWDTETGKLLTDLRGHSSVESANFSPDGKKIVTASRDGTSKIWDVETGKLFSVLAGHSSSVYSATFSPDGKMIVTLLAPYTKKVWDVETGKLIVNLSGDSYYNYSMNYSPDRKKMVTFSGHSRDFTLKILDTETGNLLTDLAGHSDHITSANFSPDGKKIVTASWDHTAKIWDVETGKLLVLIVHSYDVNSAHFSPDGKKIVTASRDKTAKIWDAENGKLLTDLKGHSSGVNSANFSPDGNKIVTASRDFTAKIWDVETGKLLPDLGHSAEVNSAHFSPDSRKIVTASSDNTSKIWDSESGVLLYTFFAIDSTDYFNLTPEGYYQCSPNAAKLLHYVTKDLKVITFEQLDVKYNRPDKVLEAIGCEDTALINSYRKAYFKRIKKLGIDTTSFRGGYSVPESDFQNREAIEFEQKNEKLSLHIIGTDSSYKLDRFNIWINEIPLFGQKGFNIKKRYKNNLDTIITVILSQGDNRIETSILNANGTESYRMPLLVNYSPETKSKEKLHFIGIGIDKFSDTSYNLQYSCKDIRDLSKKLKQKFGDEIIIDTLFNEDVTISNVKALKKKLLQTSINDKVIISYSGHGLLSKDYDYYLSTYSVNFEKPQINGLPYDELENLLDSIPARKKLMLIDACHSGEVDKDEAFAMNNTADSMGLSKPKGGKTINSKAQKQLGLKNSFELMQSLFVNVGKSTGATIISAAAGNQFALEKGNLKNGVFTYCILEAMNSNSTMTVSQLKSSVGKRVEEITNGLQKPTSRNETINSDWSVW